MQASMSCINYVKEIGPFCHHVLKKKKVVGGFAYARKVQSCRNHAVCSCTLAHKWRDPM